MFGRNSSTAPQEVELRPAEDAGGEEEVSRVRGSKRSLVIGMKLTCFSNSPAGRRRDH